MRAETEVSGTAGEAPATAGVRSLYWLAGGGVLVNLFRCLQSHAAAGTLWMDPYWVNFYLTRYGDGYRRRALMGSLLSHLSRGGISIVALNILAGCVLLAGFVLLFRAMGRMTGRRDTVWAKVFLFSLAASSLSAIFYTTMGDLLQLCLVLACGSAMLGLRLVRREPLRLVLGLGMVGVCFLFHEASLFLVAPALPFLLKARPRLRDFVLPLAAMALLLAWSVHWSDRYPRPTYRVMLADGRTQTASEGAAAPLRYSLQAESVSYFSTPAARWYFAGRYPRILVLVFAYLLTLVNCLPRRVGRRTLYAFGTILVLSLPLWVIAIDWGRFLSYAFVLAVVSSGMWEGSLVAPTSQKRDVGHPVPRGVDAVWGWLERVNRRDLLRLGAVFVLLTGPEWPAPHIEGTPLVDSLAFCALAVVAMFVPPRGLDLGEE